MIALLLPQAGGIDEAALEWFSRGEAMIGTESEYTEAQADCFRKALGIEPGFREARFNLVIVLLSLEEFLEAEEQAAALLEDDPDDTQALLLRAEALAGQGRNSEAERDLDALLQRNPDSGRAWEVKGSISFEGGAYREAAQAWKKALELGRESQGLRINAGLSLLNAGSPAEAQVFFSEIPELYPESWEGYYWSGVALRELERPEEAAAALEKAEEKSPDNPKVREELIDVYLGLGKLEQAGERINRKRNKTAADYANLARLSRAEGKLDDALAYYRTAAGMAPGDAAILAGYGDLQLDMELVPGAMDTYRRILELNPLDFETLVNLSGLLTEQGELAEARELLERAVSLKPDSADAHFRLALVLDKMEDYQPARENYEKALELGSENLVAHFRLAFFLAEEDDREGAMRHLATAVNGDPRKFVPHLFREVRRIKSPLDSIRYTTEFSELVNKYKDYWIDEDEEEALEAASVLETPPR